MGKLLLIIMCIFTLYVGVSEAQVVSGTVSSKVLDGIGNKITSTVSGGHRGLDVICIGGTCTGAAGATYLDADGIADQTASAVHGQSYFYNGATWDRMRGDTTNGLWVNCKNGCAGGSSTPSDAFVNPVTAGLQMSFSMGYNGATWDRLRSTIAGGLLVDVSDAFLLDATFTTRINTLGQKAMAASTPVVLASDQASIPVAATVTNSFLLDATFTGRFAAAYVDADTIANQTTTAVHGQLYGYNGATWDRLRSTIAGGLLVDVSDAFALDATVTNRLPAGSTPADNESNAVTFSRLGVFNYVYDGATWDRWTGSVTATNAFLLDATYTGRMPAGASPADNESNTNTALSRIGNFNFIYDGANWDRWTGAVTVTSGTITVGNAFLLDATFTGRFAAAYIDADAIANQTTTAVHGQLYGYNGTTWDRLRSTTANGLAVDVTRVTGTVTVQGAKTNNNAAPGATNVGVLPCVATAAAPSNTEGNQTGCSQNLLGAQRTIEQNFVATSNSDGSCPSGAASFTVIASNASRTWLAVWASPANTDDVYIKLAATATTSDARFAPGQALNFTSGRIYTGIIDAIPASGTQAVCVMELN